MKTNHDCPTLLRELEEATLLARTPSFADSLQSVGLTDCRAESFGIAKVIAGQEFYEPHEDGVPALIVPAIEQGCLVDLVACAFGSRLMRTRYGIARLLGLDYVFNQTFFADEKIEVFTDAFAWLQGACQGVVVIDWQFGHWPLRDLPAIKCADANTGKRLRDAFVRPNPYPPIHLQHGVTL
ncbi:MAG: hypothetical protein WCP68_09715 [Enhydrobacter sp.]